MTEPLDLIVTADWLAAHRDEPDLVVVDVRPADRYAAGHIPGARSIDLYPMKIRASAPGMVAAWVETMQAAFRRLGIREGDRVVFYEDFSGTTAARGAWLMRALSIGTGGMLDGGLGAWMAGGYPVDAAPVAVPPSSVTARLDPALFATADDVLRAIEDGDVIIDTRGELEWMQGTIPTARHLEWVHHLTPEGTFKPIEALRQMYQDLGLTPDDEIVTFCASGYRAAHTWLVLTLLGYERVGNYAPSWGEWGQRPDLPVARTR